VARKKASILQELPGQPEELRFADKSDAGNQSRSDVRICAAREGSRLGILLMLKPITAVEGRQEFSHLKLLEFEDSRWVILIKDQSTFQQEHSIWVIINWNSHLASKRLHGSDHAGRSESCLADCSARNCAQRFEVDSPSLGA